MITVEMPDGTRVQFPDGTSRETMLSALRKKFPPKQGSTYEEMIAKAKQLAAAGDTAGAKRLAEIAIKRRNQPMSNDPASYTADQYQEAARKALAAGDTAAAKRLIARGRDAEGRQRNPDGTYGQPPEGFVLNPATGQMEDMRSPNNPNIASGRMNAGAQGLGQLRFQLQVQRLI